MAKTERVHVEVNDETIAHGNSWVVIHPVWWSASIYDGPGIYDQQFSSFSDAQRHVFAIHWYVHEVENGGHKQFYSNSTGIVWPDARDGFEAIGLPRGATISANRLGGNPSRDRLERWDQMEQESPDFGDCDDALYSLLEKVNLEDLLMDYIRSRPEDFYFSGEIERVVLPGVKPPAGQ